MESPVPDKRRVGFGRIELGLAVCFSLLALWLHATFRLHAGGLWRDEVNSVHLATLPGFAETWRNLQFDSFPILFFTLLRGWSALFAPTNDAAYRMLGLLIGVTVFAALWLNARRVGGRWPALSIALLGCNPLFIRYADSVRGYGLGMLLMLLTFGAIWRVVASLTPGRVAAAMGLAMLSVQALYYNSVLLLAMCLGGALAAGWSRQWKKAAWILAIGAPAAASIAVYAPTFRKAADWNFLVHHDPSLAWFWTRFSELISSPAPVGQWLWPALALGGVAAAFWRLGDRTRADPALLFAAATLVIATVGYVAFLYTLQYYTRPWYYVSYLALAATCLDAIFARVTAAARAPWATLAPAGVGAAFVAIAFFPAGVDVLAPQTNVDLIAARLTRDAAPGDLILHVRWECSVTFARYYRGAAGEISTPPFTDRRFHRYDLIFEQMKAPDPMRPVLDKLAETLRAGHRVWVVGTPLFLPPGQLPGHPRPAWKENGKWQLGGDYYDDWATQASYFLQTHVLNGEEVPVPMPHRAMYYEDLQLSVLSVWKDAP